MEKTMGDINSEELEHFVEEGMKMMENAINQAAMKELLKKAREESSGVKLEVNEKILDSCTTLIKAIMELVYNIKKLQQEIVEQGRGTGSVQEFYKLHHQWTEGLFSDIKAVGIGDRVLVETADRTMSGNGKYEELRVVSHKIAGSVAQLVIALRIKVDAASPQLAAVSSSSKNVTSATAAVVGNVKAAMKILNIKDTMTGKAPHLIRTALQSRQQAILAAYVTALNGISPTVNGITLKVDQSHQWLFKAGQWLDLFVPGISHVGGFSMWSTPSEFYEKGTVRLAIKISEDPVAQWVHNKCIIGDRVQFRFGGDFFYDPSLDEKHHSLCLIAGGVGVNPLMSILTETLRYDQEKSIQRQIMLFQAAKNMDELLFEEETASVCKANENFQRHLFITGQNGKPGVENRRILRDDLQSAMEELGKNTNYFICGPAGMIDETVSILNDLGVPSECIFFEKWS